MKKSAVYNLAIMSIIEDQRIETCVKPEILEVLMEDKKVALWSEKQEEQKNESVSN